MEEKKLDLNSIIGFALIFGLLLWIMYQNQPTETELAEQAKKEQISKKAESNKVAEPTAIVVPDSLVKNPDQLAKLQNVLGNFAYSATLNSAKENLE